MESALFTHKYRTELERMSSKRTVTMDHAVEIYFAMNGVPEYTDRVFTDEVEGLVPPNGASFRQWLGWNHAMLTVVEAIE